MKTIFIGDVHCKPHWKKIVKKENADRVIFIGDYFDSFDPCTPVEQLHNIKEILDYKLTSGKDVILLIGNHDYHYIPGTEDKCSGYQLLGAISYGHFFKENLHHFQMCYQSGNLLCSHAGVSIEWLADIGYEGWDDIAGFVNDVFKYQPNNFGFRGRDPYGDDTYQTPIWIRPKSLMRANKKSFLKRDFIQIVGHTHMSQIDVKGFTTGGRYFFIDCMPEYLILEDGVFSSAKLEPKEVAEV